MTQQAEKIQITIKNCNNIDSAEICIVKDRLNIKYGPNGLGKSTIAKAIVSKIRNDGTLNALIPFKNQGKPGVENPTVIGVDDFTSALVFDEEYVNQFVFQQDEVVKNSFDIFVKTADYVKGMAEIEGLFAGIKKAFSDNEDIEQTLRDLIELSAAFGKSKPGVIPKNSKMHKAFCSGNKIDNVPESLKPFETFIKRQEPSKWIKWQIDGNQFFDVGGDICPYCSTSLSDDTQKEIVRSVAKEYDATSIGHLIALKAVIDRLGKYFSHTCLENLDKVTKAKIELTSQEIAFLSSLKTDIDALIEKLEGLRSISFYYLRDVNEIDGKIKLLKIDIKLIDKLDSDETRKVVDPINEQLEALVTKVGSLKGKINQHKSRIEKSIKENKESINNFLKSAGYKYSVTIIPEPASYKMKLIHEDHKEYIETASKYLSYGEKNAFSLVLFMHQVLSNNPDIVVLDDPISSFDKNKKFAIIHELFHGKSSLKGHTTIMLTHDIEPAIDVIKSLPLAFQDQGLKPSAAFLSSRGGVVKEEAIQQDDIQTFAQICANNITNLTDPIIKAIYLRRHHEILDDFGSAYNLLASLFHNRHVPTIKTTDGKSREMTSVEKAAAEQSIIADIAEFDYDDLLKDINNAALMKQKFLDTNVGYEKLQLFRIINGQHADDVIAKFINESYHIENEYVMQLNPHKFESIPEYVVDECTRIINK